MELSNDTTGDWETSQFTKPSAHTKQFLRSDVCTRASVAQVAQDLVSNFPQFPVLP